MGRHLSLWKPGSLEVRFLSGSVCLCSNEEGYEFWAQLLL